jgi:cytochrome c-type biogenesis protein CcmH/NrfG
VLTYLGRSLLQLGRYEDALQVFRSAYELNPGNSVAAFYFAELSRDTATGRYFSLPGPDMMPKR